MIVGITGASGFIGQELVSECLRQNHRVRILTRTIKKATVFSGDVEVFFGDLIDEHIDLTSFVDGLNIIYHCAGEINDRLKMELLHVNGTQRLLGFVESYFVLSGRSVHWVQLSSVGVYGPSRNQASDLRFVTEESSVWPKGKYEESKAESDALVLNAQKKGYLTYTVIRPSNVIGKKMPNKSLFQLGTLIKRGLFFYIGKHDAVATYIHISDLIRLMCISGFDIRARNKIFNLSNDCSLVDMVEAMASAVSVKNPRLRFPEFFVRGGVSLLSKFIKLPVTNDRIDALVTRTHYPYTKLIQELNFRPEKPIPEIIQEVVVIY